MLANRLAAGWLDQQMSCHYFLCDLDHLSTGKTPRCVGGIVCQSHGIPWGIYREHTVKCDPGKLEFPGLLSSTYLICARIRRSYARTGTAESGEVGSARFFLLHLYIYFIFPETLGPCGIFFKNSTCTACYRSFELTSVSERRPSGQMTCTVHVHGACPPSGPFKTIQAMSVKTQPRKTHLCFIHSPVPRQLLSLMSSESWWLRPRPGEVPQCPQNAPGASQSTK